MTRLRIALVSRVDPDDRAALSGMPFSMASVLRSRGATVYPISWEAPLIRMSRSIHRKYRRMAKESLTRLLSLASRHNSDHERQMVLSRATKASSKVCKLVQHKNPQVLLGCCMSSALYAYDCQYPVVYFSDATPDIINSTYPVYQKRTPGYKSACDELERVALQRVAFAVYGTQATLRRAIDSYGLSPEKGSVAHMGANVGLHDLGADDFQPDTPTKGSLKLCIIAADPVRKRLDLVIETTQILASRGWRATLTYVGPSCASARESALIHCAGPLMMTNELERKQLARLVADSHVMLLPSLGEAFGIAPCEAAVFGRPSVVSAVGGLPEVVKDGVTGTVLPVEAGPREYADAVERIVSSPERYREMSRVTMQRAERELTWNSWADKIIPLLERAASHVADN